MPQETLLTLIRERIRQNGALSVADYMALALSHPEYGYYMRKDPLGAQGDFTTAPEISQVFGELAGLWLCEQWRKLGKPQAALAELGPGRGTLMNDILRATRNIPGFHDALSVHMVETSPALQQKQWKALAGKHPAIQWHASVAELPDKPLLLVANEFFDALPIQQFICDDDGWHERAVGLDANGELCLTVKTLALPFPEGKKGDIRERSSASEAIVQAVSRHIARSSGAALIVDYGYTGGTRGDTWQAMKDHQYHDPLADPGSADLTAHVDFDRLAQVAATEGVETYGAIPQGMFLGRLGAVPRAVALCERAEESQQLEILAGVERLVSPDMMGDLFKVLCIVPAAYGKPEGF